MRGASLGERRRDPYGHARSTRTRMPRLFSYGTLQQDNLQLATFGRRLFLTTKGRSEACALLSPAIQRF
jgi:hypothetical protein